MLRQLVMAQTNAQNVVAANAISTQQQRYLTDDEERSLIHELPKSLRPLVMVAIHTGMRRGELLNLTWHEVDLVGNAVLVRKSKSGEGRRIPMSTTVRRTLNDLNEARQRKCSGGAQQSETSQYVFTAPRGGFLGNLNRVWYAAIEHAGLVGLHFHDLRHTFASRLVMNGVDLFRVQTLMGHKSSRMTIRYAHLSPEHLRAAVATLDAPGPKPWSSRSAASGGHN
jgi:integrase